MSNTKRVMMYIIPVTILSFALNIPKFMEVTVTENNGTNEVDTTDTRKNPTFIFWYTLSLIWHPTLTTGILPFIGLVYMNIQIFITVRKTRSVSISILQFANSLIVIVCHQFILHRALDIFVVAKRIPSIRIAPVKLKLL